MRAVLSQAPGGPETLCVEEIPDPEPKARDVLVRVHACGVNYPDTLLIRDLYQVKPTRPFSPGAEIAGIVEAVGSDVRGFAPGDRVIGRLGWGGMADKLLVPAGRLTHMPPQMSMEEGATFLFTYATSYYAIKDCGRAKTSETMLVLGASGGVGSAACAIGQALGLRVLAATSSPTKLDFAMKNGAEDGVIYPAALEASEVRNVSSSFRSIGGARGIDIVFDAVGGQYSEAALRSLNPGGRHLVVGFAAGISSMPLNLPLLKSCSIVGVNWRQLTVDEPERNVANTQALLDLYVAGKLRPIISARYSLEKAGDAIALLDSRRASGKVVVNLV